MSEELKKLTKVELIKRAAKSKIGVAPSMSKDELVSALKKAAAKTAKPDVTKKAAAAVKPAKSQVATAKPAAAKKPAATKAAKKPAAVTAKPAASKKATLAPAKPVATSKAKATAAKAAKTTVKLAAEPKVSPVRAAAAKGTEKQKSATRKPAAVESKAVVAETKNRTGKRLAGTHPASPTPPLNAGKEPSLSPAVSPLSVNTIAANNGKRSWDIKIDEKKFFIADEKYDYTQHGDQLRLPDRYGDMRVIAMARDPFKLYIYWELDGGGVERARAKLNRDWPELSWVMRVFDVTGVEFNGANANRHFDVDLNPYLGSVYMDVDKAGHEYIVVLGLRDSEGRFEPVAASNKVRTPRVGPSPQTDVEWSLPEGLFTAIYGISGGYSATTSGSLDSSNLGLPLGGVSSLGVSSFESVSSGAFSSFGSSEQMAGAKQRKFFFWLDCELIVYGGTEPDAIVHLKGKKIDLRPDGTFTARFSLPDGVYDIPVTAKSSDGVELREISPTASRTTRRKEEFLIPEGEWLKK